MYRQDPYSRQASEQYRSEDYRGHGDPRGTGGSLFSNLIGGAAKMAMGFAKFSLALGAVKYGRGLLTKSIPALLKKSDIVKKAASYVDDTPLLRNGFRTFHTQYNKLKSKLVTDTLSKYSSDVSVYNNWKNRWTNIGSAVAKRKSAHLPHVGRTAAQGYRLEKSYYRAKLASFWKPKQLEQRLTGKIVVGANNMKRDMVDFYMADQFLNVFNDRKYGEEKTPLWNVPGHAWNFAKYTASTAPMFMMFGALGPMFKLGKEAGTEAAVKAAKGVNFQKVSNYLLPRMAKTYPKMELMGKSVHEFYNSAQKEGFHDFLRHPIRTAKKSKNILLKAIEDSKKRLVNEKTAVKQPPINTFLKDVVNVVGKIDIRRKDNKNYINEIINKSIKDYNSQFKTNSLLEQVLGQQRYLLPEREIMEAVSGAGTPARQKFLGDIFKRLTVKGVPLADKGIYQGHGKTMLDLRSIMPSKLFQNFARAMTELIRIPGTNVSIPGLLGSRALYRDKKVVSLLNEGTYALGTYRPNMTDWSVKDAAKAASQFIDDNGTIKGYFIPGFQNKNKFGMYAGGKWFAYSKPDTSRAGKIIKLLPDSIEVPLVKAGSSSGITRVQKAASGLSELRSGDKNEYIEAYGPIKGRFMHMFDISKMHESVFGKARAIVGKYLWGDTPLKIEKLRNRAMSSGEQEEMRSFGTVLRSLVGRNRGFFSKGLKKHRGLFDAIGIDPQMADAKLIEKVTHIINNPEKYSNNEYAKKLIKQYDVRRLMSSVKDKFGEYKLNSIATRVGSMEDMTYREQFLEFLFATKVSGTAKKETVNNFHTIINSLSGTDDAFVSSFNIWKKELKAGNKFKELLGNGLNTKNTQELISHFDIQQGGAGVDDLKNIIESIYKTYTPLPWKQKVLQSRWLKNPRYKETESEILRGSRMDWIAQPSRGINYSFTHKKNLEILSDGNLEKIPELLTKTSGLSLNEQQILDAYNNYFVGGGVRQFGSIDLTLGVLGNRLNSLFGWFGMGLDASRYTGNPAMSAPSDFLVKGLVAKRVLPIMGVVAGGWAVDKAVDINPLFSGTALDEGLGVFAAEQGVKARLLASHVYDTTGVTQASKYLSGLMPGSVNSPLMRATRAILPTYIGAKAGSTFGPQGAGIGMLLGAGLSAAQGFGAFDLDKTNEELKDIYSGREYVPVRKGRLWLLSSGNFSGGRISMMRPNWFARMKSKYKDTPDGLGSPLEQLMYNDLPMIDANPFEMVFGRNHYAYRKYYSYPSPLCIDKKTHIRTKNNIKLAEDIVIGDQVLTHHGKYERVNDILTKYHKTALKFNIYGFYDDIIVSNVHPFFAIQFDDCFNTRTSKYIKKCAPMVRHIKCQNCKHDKKYKANTGDWIEAKKLKKGDFVAYPRLKLTNDVKIISCFDIIRNVSRNREYFVYEDYIDFKNVWSETSNKFVKISLKGAKIIRERYKKLGLNFKTLIHQIGYKHWQSLSAVLNGKSGMLFSKFKILLNFLSLKMDNSYYEYTNWSRESLNKKNGNIPNEIILDWDFGFFIGVFLAEGWLTGPREGLLNTVGTAHNLYNDKDVVKNMIRIWKEKFNINAKAKQDSNKGQSIIVGCSILADFLNNFVGNGSYEKRLNFDYLTHDVGFLKGLLNGYFLGDGKLNNRTTIMANSVNISLLSDIKDILNGFGIVSSLQRRENDFELHITGIFAENLYNLFKIKGSKFKPYDPPKIRRTFRTYIDDDYFYYKIEDIEEIQYNKYMLDFTVANSHSFCSLACTLHNTDTPFQEAPFVGPTLAGTVGRIIKPPRLMHKEELMRAMGNKPAGFDRNYLPSSMDSMFSTENMKRTPIKGENPVWPSDAKNIMDKQIYNFTEAIGLYGFGLETLADKTFGATNPYASAKVLGSAGDITSFRRAYWDMHLGDPVGASELFRRMVPRRTYAQKSNIFNPLLNVMPSYMPHRFHIGNPATTVEEAEFRLPGKGFESARDVKHTFPIEADALGLSTPDIVRKMLGMYPKNMSPRESNQERINKELKARSVLYDPYLNVAASFDGVIREGRKKVATKIKNLSNDELDSFIGASEADKSEMNFILKMTGSPSGLIQYQFQGQPVAVEPVMFSERRWERDIIRIQQAREMAQRLYASGLGFGGESYSHIDRLKVLSDVAPSSPEYKREKRIVEMQIKAGYVSQNEYDKIERIRNARLMSQELFPYRFCISENLLIQTIDGLKPANRINIGELLLTEDGQYHKVNKIFVRDKIKEDEMVSISSENQRIQSLDITTNHEVLGVRKGQCKKLGKYKTKNKQGYYPCKPNQNTKCSKYCGDPDYTHYKIEWIRARDLAIGDFIAYPKPQFGTVSNIVIDLAQMTDKCFSDKYIYSSASTDYIRAYELLEAQPGLTRKDLIGFGLDPGRVSAALHSFRHNMNILRYNRFIPLNKEIYRLIGFYLAEGSASSRQVHFDLHLNEIDIQNEIINTSNIYFGNHSHNVYIDGNSRRVQINNNGLALFLKYVANSGLNKFINSVILQDDPNLLEMIECYRLGDGNHSSQLKQKIISSSNINLLNQIKDILLFFGKRSGLYIKQLEKEGMIGNKKVKSKKSYVLYYEQDFNRGLFILDNFCLFEIKDISKKSIDFKLYDFEIDGVHSYAPFGFIVHNSINKILTPDAEYNNLSLNKNIKAAAEYTLTERIVGSAYEGFAHLDTPIHSRFHHIRSPREAYERGYLYGRNLKQWSDPIDHFADAYRRGFMSKQTPLSGAIAGFVGGSIAAPGLGSAIGVTVGAIYGGLNGVYRRITGETYIPGSIKEERAINTYFDKLEYNKNMMMYRASGDEAYLDLAKSTAMGFAPSDKGGRMWTHMFRATPPQERDYLMGLINVEDDSEREEVLKIVPGNMKNLLSAGWGKTDSSKRNSQLSYANTMPMPSPDWHGWSDEIQLDDVKLKTIEKEGLDAYNFNLGWGQQRDRIESNPYIPGPINMSDVHGEEFTKLSTQNVGDLRISIERALQSVGIQGSVSIMSNQGRNSLQVVNQ